MVDYFNIHFLNGSSAILNIAYIEQILIFNWVFLPVNSLQVCFANFKCWKEHYPMYDFQ